METKKAESINLFLTAFLTAALFVIFSAYYWFVIHEDSPVTHAVDSVRMDTVYIIKEKIVYLDAPKILPGTGAGVPDTSLYSYADSTINLRLWGWPTGSRLSYALNAPTVTKTVYLSPDLPRGRVPVSRLAVGTFAGLRAGGPALRYASRVADFWAGYDIYNRAPMFGIFINIGNIADRQGRNPTR